MIESHILRLLAAILSIALIAMDALAAPQVMKKDALAASGQCLIQATSADVESDILDVYRITLRAARPEERAALARGLLQVYALYGDVFNGAIRTEFRFSTRRGYSRYEGYIDSVHRISMNRCNSKGKNCRSNNVAHMMHELGHRIGHSVFVGRESMYQAYRRLGGNCQPTRYSRKNRNEEFAEVFAAFITHPEILRHGDGDCRRAYAFFARDVFYKNGELASCGSIDRQRLAASVNRLEPIQVASAEPRPVPVAAAKPQPQIDDDWSWGEEPQDANAPDTPVDGMR